MKKLYLSLCLVVTGLLLKAQEQAYFINWSPRQADSVKVELRKNTNDTLRMEMSRLLGIYHQEINRDTALVYHHLQLELAQKLRQKLWEADAYDASGWLFSQGKNYSRSLQYLLTAKKMAEDKSTEKNIWQLELFSKDRNPGYARVSALAFVYNDLSQLYRLVGDTENEISYLRRGIAVSTQIGNESLLGLLKSNLAHVMLTLNRLDSVIFYGKQALAHMQRSGYKTYEGYQLVMLGDAYIQKKNFDTAKTYLDQSLIANEVNQSIVQLPEAYLSYAVLCKGRHQPDSGRKYLHKAVSAFTSLGVAGKVNIAYRLLYRFHNDEGHTDSAFHYLQLHQSLSDSLNEREETQRHAYQKFAFREQIERQEAESQRIRKATTNRTYALLSGVIILLVIAFLLIRNNRVRRKANQLLQQQKTEVEQQKIKVETTLSELRNTQRQLIQSEKMASLGELTAGIAHEIQNPLNFVNNFSEVNNELVSEAIEEMDKSNLDGVRDILQDIKDNSGKINHHGRRADAIVKGMLQHSRKSEGQKEPTDINALCDEYLRLSYHGLRAKDKSFHAILKTDFDETVGKVDIIPQDMGRVIMNLLTNAFYAVNARNQQALQSNAPVNYEPTVSITTRKISNKIEIKIADNGDGIPPGILDKIFQPFFTTKPTGEGTGLGLSLSHDIVKGHNGEIKVETAITKGTQFTIQLPC